MKMQVVWIEIPVSNIEHAVQFYSALFDAKFDIISGDVRQISITALPPDVTVGVSLNQTANFEPGGKGLFVSFAAGNEIETILARVEPAGGKIITRRGALLAPDNYYASLQDTEGNVLGFVWAEQS